MFAKVLQVFFSGTTGVFFRYYRFFFKLFKVCLNITGVFSSLSTPGEVLQVFYIYCK